MDIIIKIVIIITAISFLTSCEGFKILTIHNQSNLNTKITVKPRLNPFKKQLLSNYPSKSSQDSSVVILEPDSSLVILSIFTSLMFKTRIDEYDLRSNFLKIETQTDTVIAKSKSEIVELMYSRKEKAIRAKVFNVSKK